MKESSPRISVITSLLNGEATLQRAIDSFASQEYPNKEMIIIDGASSDSSVDILRANDHLIHYWESKPDRGIYHAWNKALDHMTGEWFCFLGCDDYFLDERVFSIVAQHLAQAAPSFRIVYGKIVSVSPVTGKPFETVGMPWEVGKKVFHKDGWNPAPHQGVFHHRSLLEIHGKFDDSFEISGDFEFMLRELKDADALFMEDIIVAARQWGGTATDPNHMMIVMRERALARQKNNVAMNRPNRIWVYLKSYVLYLLHRHFGRRVTRSVVDLYRKLTGREPIWG